uniref:Ig-like domain-containing protein n=1 Tax=Oreochromis niloticus TaxID=8128 RepID=A0A669F4M1_ORENI
YLNKRVESPLFQLVLYAWLVELYLNVCSLILDQYAATIGEDVTLQCRAPRDAVVTVLEWSKPDLSLDDYVFFYRNERSYEKYQHSSFRGRVTLRESSMKDGDVSIVLKNVTVSDAGRYKCRIIMSNAASSERVLSEERSLNVTEAGEFEFVVDETYLLSAQNKICSCQPVSLQGEMSFRYMTRSCVVFSHTDGNMSVTFGSWRLCEPAVVSLTVI